MVVRVEPDHGTRARYVHRTFKCRCMKCRAENTSYQQTRRHNLRMQYVPRTWTEQRLPGIGD